MSNPRIISYRTLGPQDAESFWALMNQLDKETIYMMYEPGERETKGPYLPTLQRSIQDAVDGGDFLLSAVENGRIVGYIWAERGKFNRNSHTAYLVTGILKNYHNLGIGTEFFRQLDWWALNNQITRLELTVECPNIAAIHLYEKSGFKREGIRRQSMLVDGYYVDEYYMAKILDFSGAI